MKNLLPEYEPEDKIWQNIKSKLDKGAIENHLPQYEPPIKVWKSINNKLNSSFKYKWMAAAASIICVIGIYFYTKMPIEKISYSVEKIEIQAKNINPIENQKAYKEILQICEKQTIICQKPEFRTLKNELDELTSASNDIKTAMGDFNTEPELLAQLNNIEIQKNEVIKKMAAKI